MPEIRLLDRVRAVTLNQVIEILQTEESTRFHHADRSRSSKNKPMQQELSVNYVSYDSRSKKYKKPSNEQNSSSSNSTGPTSA